MTRSDCIYRFTVSEAFRGLVDGRVTTISRLSLEATRLTPIIQFRNYLRGTGGTSTFRGKGEERD